MQDYAPYAAKLSKQFWLNIIISLVSQIMVEKFTPVNFFGLSGTRPVVSARKLIGAFEGQHLR
jgi:hypothetical protein